MTTVLLDSVCRQEQRSPREVVTDRLSNPIFFPRDEYFMRLALREAERALEHEDVPVGCVVAREQEVIGAAPNERELRGDPTAHAEILALREASASLGSWRLSDCVVYITLEPCAMCAGALVLARVPRVVYGAVDPKAVCELGVSGALAEPSSEGARAGEVLVRQRGV